MLTLYFSATGNTEYIARLFSRQMGAKCLSIESDANFAQEIIAHGCIAFCYPIYGSRVPRILREFVAQHMGDLDGKKVIILVTQVAFSGDGARVFTDMLFNCAVDVIYAEHFYMPNNVSNILILRKPSEKSVKRRLVKAEEKVLAVCQDINNGIVIRRGFSRFSRILGSIQGKLWQGDSSKIGSSALSAESMSKTGVKIRKDCTACNLCVSICPMKNFANEQGSIRPKGNCMVCYRCINRCPKRAITVMVNIRPRWQYEGV